MAKKSVITGKNIVLAICSIIIVGIGFGFLPEILGDEVEKALKSILGDYYYPVILGFFGFVVLVWLIIFLYDKRESVPNERDKVQDLRAEFIRNLKLLYEKRLHDKMLGDLNFEIKLNLNYTTKGNSEETIEDFFIVKKEIRAGDFDRLFNKFKSSLWRILILGEPGSGKSILILRFGLRLIELAEKDSNFPIPILFDLATWNNSDQSFENWMEMTLPYIGGSFAVSKADAKQLIESRNILPLLDGFDEIRPQFRNSCLAQLLPYLQKVKTARKESYPEVIICSRILEYEKAEDAPVFASVKIQQLTENDVKTALKPLIVKQNFIAAKRLQTALNDQPELYLAITSAFFMHTLLDLSQSSRLNFQGKSKVALQKEITEAYVSNELEKTTSFPKEKVKKYLGWLAWKMKYLEGTISFELIDLQPRWVKGRYSFMLAVWLVTSFITCFGLFIISGFNLTLLLSFVIGLYYSYELNHIETEEIQVFDFRKIDWDGFKTILYEGLSVAMVSGLFGSFANCLFFKFIDNFFYDIVFGFLSFFLLGFLIGLFFGLIHFFTVEASFPKITSPYKRFIAEFWRVFFQWTFIILLLILLINWFAKDFSTLYLGPFIGLIVSIVLSPILLHISIRFVLWIESVIPLNFVTFLDSVSNTGLMIKDGGKWRFRHQLIHDYLAVWYENTYQEKLKESHLEILKKQREKE